MKKEEIMEKCICAGCPTWEDCSHHGGKKELGFCTEGKSGCIKMELTCLCGACPVFKKMKFKNGFYCTRGDESKQEE
jgi:hypothetical protein